MPKPKGPSSKMKKTLKPEMGDAQKYHKKTKEELLDEIAYLRAEVAYLKKRRALIQQQKIKPSMMVRFITKSRQNHHLGHLLRAFEMARSTYSYHFRRLKCADKYFCLKAKINDIYHKHKGRYGYRRITLALKNRGVTINHKCVQQLMKLLGLKS